MIPSSNTMSIVGWKSTKKSPSSIWFSHNQRERAMQSQSSSRSSSNSLSRSSLCSRDPEATPRVWLRFFILHTKKITPHHYNLVYTSSMNNEALLSYIAAARQQCWPGDEGGVGGQYHGHCANHQLVPLWTKVRLEHEPEILLLERSRERRGLAYGHGRVVLLPLTNMRKLHTAHMERRNVGNHLRESHLTVVFFFTIFIMTVL